MLIRQPKKTVLHSEHSITVCQTKFNVHINYAYHTKHTPEISGIKLRNDNQQASFKFNGISTLQQPFVCALHSLMCYFMHNAIFHYSQPLVFFFLLPFERHQNIFMHVCQANVYDHGILWQQLIRSQQNSCRQHIYINHGGQSMKLP